MVHSGSLYVSLLDASGLIPGEEYIICLDLDGLGRPQSYGDTGLRAYVTPLASVRVKGSFPTHLAVPKGSFTLQARP